MKRFAAAALALVLTACSSSAGRHEEVSISTSDKARDILGMNLLLSGMRDRRENVGLRAWSFKIRNNEKNLVMVRAVPLFVAEDGRELGGSAEAQEGEIKPGLEREFYFKAPTGEAAKLLVKFELK
ncbi:MAG: hypothetical protein K8T20_13990 [Planctomycetes bacterium]|nr:hypothetical protein [Planctomycetota bacterium]